MTQEDFEYEVWVPTYNGESTVGATLESILNQKRAPSRLVLADDGSTDQTVSIAESLGVEVFHSGHLGLAGIENAAIRLVEAPFVAFVDSDDLWVPEAADLYASAFGHAPDRTAAIAGHAALFAEGTEPPLQLAGKAIASDLKLRQIEPTELWAHNPFHKSSTVFRTSALLSVDGYRSLPSSEDYDLLLRLMAEGWLLHEENLLTTLVAVRQNSMISVGPKMLEGHVDALKSFSRSEFFSQQLPGQSYERAARRFWLRAVAAAAVYRKPLSSIPSLTTIDPDLRDVPAIGALVRSPISPILAAGWRLARRLRGKHDYFN